jgi:HEAT repeat protein
MFKVDDSNHEVKHEAEINNIAILKELKLFFINNKHQSSEPQDCGRYNNVLEAHEAHKAILVYDEEEKVHKLWVNDEPLESQSAIQMLTAIIESLELLNAQNTGRTPKAASFTTSPGNTCVQEQAKSDGLEVIRDKIKVKGGIVAGGPVHIGGVHTIINNPVYINHVAGDSVHTTTNNLVSPTLDEADLDSKAAQALEQLKAGYATPEYTTINGIFGRPLTLAGQYINLQILCTDLKTKKPEEDKESKESLEAKPSEKYKDARMASVEDLFGDKRVIKTEDLFKPTRALFNNQVQTQDTHEAPRLLLVQGRAGIGKTTFVRYAAHEWSKGRLYTNYTWIFTLTLRKLRLFPATPELSLSEWIRLSQFNDWEPKEFEELWKQRIEAAIHQNQVMLILDGYDETPENHPCQSILKNLLTGSGRYAKLSLLMTTRPSSAEGISQKRRNLEIIGFTDENINEYIQSYFESSEQSLVNTFKETLRKQPIIWANAHIPLNLNLLCGIMGEAIEKTQVEGLSQGLAGLSSMTRLYQVMEKKLYERSYTRREVVLPNALKQQIRVASNFIQHYEKERLFLAKLAFQSFEVECIIIPLQAIGAALQTYIDKGATSQQQKEALGETFFKTVCELGLIKPVLDKSGLSETKQNYEFLHLTFQEYYTAIYLASRLSSKEPAAQTFAQSIISKEKYNPRWQIVWWFVAGLLRENLPAYQAYLQQLQGQSTAQKNLFEHYPLGLLTRCLDEGFEPQNQKVIEPIVKQLQSSFLKLYQTAKNVTNNNKDALSELSLINSPFFSAYRISSNLCMSRQQDLYVLIAKPQQPEDKVFLSAWIGAIRVVTPKAMDALLGLLSDEDSDVRRSAADALGKLGEAAATPKVLDGLIGLFSDKDQWVRLSGVFALDKMKETAATPAVLDALLGRLSDEDDLVRISAVFALGKMKKAAATPKVLDALLGLLTHERNDVRWSAADALGQLGEAAATPKVLDALLGRLSDEESNVRRSAADALAATPKMLDPLLGLLTHGNSDVRRSVADALGKLGEAAATPKVLDALLGWLSDEDGSVRRSVADALGKLGEAAATPKVLDALLGWLSDEDGSVRCSAVRALGDLGGAAATPKVLDALLGLLSDKGDYVRLSAAFALGKMKEAAATPKVLDELLGLLSSDKELHVRLSAAEALSNLGTAAATPAVLDALWGLLSDEDSYAAWALGNLGEAAATPAVLDALLGGLSDEDSWVRGSAADALGKMKEAAATPKVLDALLGLLTHGNSDVRRSVADALGQLGEAAATPKVLDALLGLLSDEESNVRRDAADVLGNRGEAAATPKVLDALLGLLSDKESMVRDSAASALDKLSNALAPPVFLDWLLKISSAANNDKVLHCFETGIERLFTLMPSFWSGHANHPNILAFVSYALGAAYLNSHIICQIDFDKEGSSGDYCMRGVAGKSRYCFLITERQAQSLAYLSSLVIEQLSKTGKLDIANLKMHLVMQKPISFVQNLLSGKKEAGSTSAQKGSPMLSQYQQGFEGAAEARTHQSYREVKSVCRIS